MSDPKDYNNYTPAPGRAFSGTSASPVQQASAPGRAMDRAMSALRFALPLVQRLLPLLDGSIAPAAADPCTRLMPASQAPPPVDLEPIENGLAYLTTQHHELHDQVLDQNLSLKRVEDQLEIVREATERNSLQQRDLLEEMLAASRKVNLFAFLALALLGVSVLLNVFLFLQLRHILP